MGNAYAPVATEEGGGGGGGAKVGGGGWCSCGAMNDMIYGVSPEEKQRREFFKTKAHVLTEGLLFRLVATAAEEESLGKKLGSWFGGVGSGSGGKKATGPLTDTDIWVSCDEELLELEWRSMQNVAGGGKPKDSGIIKLCTIKTN